MQRWEGGLAPPADFPADHPTAHPSLPNSPACKKLKENKITRKKEHKKTGIVLKLSPLESSLTRKQHCTTLALHQKAFSRGRKPFITGKFVCLSVIGRALKQERFYLSFPPYLPELWMFPLSIQMPNPLWIPLNPYLSRGVNFLCVKPLIASSLFQICKWSISPVLVRWERVNASFKEEFPSPCCVLFCTPLTHPYFMRFSTRIISLILFSLIS